MKRSLIQSKSGLRTLNNSRVREIARADLAGVGITPKELEWCQQRLRPINNHHCRICNLRPEIIFPRQSPQRPSSSSPSPKTPHSHSYKPPYHPPRPQASATGRPLHIHHSPLVTCSILLQRFHHSTASARCDTALRATSSSGVKSSYLNQMPLPPGVAPSPGR